MLRHYSLAKRPVTVEIDRFNKVSRARPAETVQKRILLTAERMFARAGRGAQNDLFINDGFTFSVESVNVEPHIRRFHAHLPFQQDFGTRRDGANTVEFDR